MTAAPGKLSCGQLTNQTLRLELAGDWRLSNIQASLDPVLQQLESADIKSLTLAAEQLTAWDSGLLTFLIKLENLCGERKIQLDTGTLPAGAARLLALAGAVPVHQESRRDFGKKPFFTVVGEQTIELFRSSRQLLNFIGSATIALGRLSGGRAIFRRQDFWLALEACGGQVLPIVSLISFLVGMILAFIGIIQLKMFGAEIYVADLVGIAMVRLMAAIMTGIIMAGRTGGAYAAQLGTMQVNQEIDALSTLGISPVEFLVLPRLLALTLMMPLLCLYANFMGILGGAAVALSLPGISLLQYYHQTVAAVGLWNLGIGLFSGTVFGIIVALSGCMRGMQCGRSASAVGDAATSAVVTAIIGIIIATAIITLICNFLGI